MLYNEGLPIIRSGRIFGVETDEMHTFSLDHSQCCVDRLHFGRKSLWRYRKTVWLHQEFRVSRIISLELTQTRLAVRELGCRPLMQ
jgi:hypothetical protein